MQVEFHRVSWPLASVFRIANRARTHAEAVRVELKDGAHIGRGEGAGVSYHGETADSLMAQLAPMKQELVNGLSRAELQRLLPPGGARNAIDCALWDLEAKRAGCRAWQLAGMATVHSLVTDLTLSLDDPQRMSEAAKAAGHYSRLKLKLGGDGDIDIERVAAVRRARPDAGIIVDANQAWNTQQLEELTPQLARLGIELIEQPLPMSEDATLTSYRTAVPLCADESCQTTESLPDLVGKYQYVNVKLDKTGGLTEALRLAHAARAAGFQLMVGCMGGASSLAMAPAFVIGQLCSVVDLDGPLLAAVDVPDGIRYEGGRMSAPAPRLWG